MIFKIENIRKHLVSPPGAPVPKQRYYEHADCGFLVTGYPDDADWLVSPLGRNISGRVFDKAPDFGWALGADPLKDHLKPHLYLLDFNKKAIHEVEGLGLTRESKIVDDYDEKHLIVLNCVTDREAPVDADRWTRDVIVVDIATATPVNRFQTRGIAFHFFDAIAITPDGWLKIGAYAHDSAHGAPASGFIRIHPLTQDYAFQPFPRQGREKLRISPSGRYVLRENLARLPVRDLAKFGMAFLHPAPADSDGKKRRYGRSVQLWSDEPCAYQRDLVIGWPSVDDLRFLPGDSAARRRNLDDIAELCAAARVDPLSGPEKTANQYTQDLELRKIAETHWKFAEFPWGHGKAGLVWQDDETAFWWNYLNHWTCVGLDGEISPPIFVKERVVSLIAKPGRIAEAVVELDHGYAKYILDGSPSDDPCVPAIAPTMTPLTTDARDDLRQLHAQTALTEIVKSSTELRVKLPSLQADDCISAIDAMTSALDRGLRWYTDRDRVIQLRIDTPGSVLDATQFFAHVESLGPAVAPALSRLV